MTKLISALMAAVFATATISPVAFAADQKKEEKKEAAKKDAKKEKAADKK
ncbi:MAG: hypothetical protein IT531_10290 [Burkholderiales bacterium]|nr:hypothetical protein [Burkholderiales bacterium]